ncbi:hypothetical protein HDR66_01790 [bacterium]|nr:hypothetical protein [bacterium]
MKRYILLSGLCVLTLSPAVASDMPPSGGYYEASVRDCNPTSMRRTLDSLTHSQRAVITVVKCKEAAPVAPVHTQYYDAYVTEMPRAPRATCADCMAPVERVVDRQYYVTETVQRYAPVVTYVPDGQYTRTRRVCDTCGR